MQKNLPSILSVLRQPSAYRYVENAKTCRALLHKGIDGIFSLFEGQV